MTNRDGPSPRVSLADRLDHLFTSVRHPDGREYSHREVAEAVSTDGAAEGVSISHSYIGMLRKGERDNPTVKHLEGIARFFGVPVAYFFNQDTAAEVDRDLDQLRALKELRVRALALRQTLPANLAELSSIIDVIKDLSTGESEARNTEADQRLTDNG